ncbi:hypothetical protein SYNPS1DRAFT_27097 [Syncephalis pseudoplumigaleata]|uniref:ZZ-type domain-containing protein n=1 Tax=Syncephalis pseudoplumigaleata TaxID=1712513 RepID=A0A4P9Z6E3_9FUNG|nr:hypothetical protein SYNPS1DRAFT_27097 [Syncephalis pseudoplumigaleata]|eukprot:RKP27240.1 hypothetical protein SYNPS1DRAFT_27097 [Syncephalis pseudoplumigaleata]
MSHQPSEAATPPPDHKLEGDNENEEEKEDERGVAAVSAQEHEILLQNEDYLLVHSALEVLREQLKQAESDLQCLARLKEQAKADPAQFVLSLCNKTRPTMPKLQPIVSIPNIELEKYGRGYAHIHSRYAADTTTTTAAANKSNAFMINAHQASLDAFQDSELSEPVASRPASEPPPSSLRAMVRQAAHMLPPRITSPDASADELDSTEDASPRPSKRQKSEASDGVSGTETRPTTPSAEVGAPRQPKQERLEQLMRIIPDEGVAAERYRRIAAALGTRTDRQVASRIQRLITKENYNSNTKLNLSQSTYRMLTMRGSVTGAVYLNLAPSILMPDEKAADTMASHEKPVTVHYGFSCDGCQVEPIVGIRWKCLQCPEEQQVDLCDSCHRIGEFENDLHRVDHPYEAWTESEPVEQAATTHDMHNYTDNDYAYLGLGT